MSKATPRNGSKVSPAPAEEEIELLDLLRALLARSRPAEEPEPFGPPQSASGETVVIDTDVDGDRYVLIRMPQVERKPPPLSPREREIVRMVAQGHPNKIIAVVLNISSWTVCTHLRRIFAKLGVSSRAAMVARLVEYGVPPEPPAMVEPPARRAAAPMRTPAAPVSLDGRSYGVESAPPAQRRVAVARGTARSGVAGTKLRVRVEAG